MSTDCPLCPYALTISEIRLQVFADLDVKSLLSAALVCKDWTWQAIDSLWRNHPIPLSWVLAPLMNSTTNGSHSTGYTSPNIEDSPDVIPERWQARLRSAEKATSLVIEITWKEVLAAKLDLHMKSRVSIMFPNAISLDLNVDGWELSGEGDDDDRWTPLLPIIVGPNVREISLKAYEITERVFQDNINTLARVAPEIHTVVIKNFPDAFSPGDFPFTQMRYLRVSSFIPHKSWRALANHPCLETIELAGFVAKPTDFTMNPQNAPIKLSHLKVLYVGYCFSGTDPKFAVALFRNTIMPALRILEVGDQDNGEHLLSPWKSAREDMLKYVREHSPMLEEFSIYGLVGSGSGG